MNGIFNINIIDDNKLLDLDKEVSDRKSSRSNNKKSNNNSKKMLTNTETENITDIKKRNLQEKSIDRQKENAKNSKNGQNKKDVSPDKNDKPYPKDIRKAGFIPNPENIYSNLIKQVKQMPSQSNGESANKSKNKLVRENNKKIVKKNIKSEKKKKLPFCPNSCSCDCYSRFSFISDKPELLKDILEYIAYTNVCENSDCKCGDKNNKNCKSDHKDCSNKQVEKKECCNEVVKRYSYEYLNEDNVNKFILTGEMCSKTLDVIINYLKENDSFIEKFHVKYIKNILDYSHFPTIPVEYDDNKRNINFNSLSFLLPLSLGVFASVVTKSFLPLIMFISLCLFSFIVPFWTTFILSTSIFIAFLFLFPVPQ